MAVGVVAFLGVLRFWQPVTGDQALMMTMGRRIVGGAVPYRDVWDLRQPLTPVWYGIVGWIFGTGEIGLRVGEIVWQSALVALIARDVERSSGSRRTAVITGIACVGPIFWTMRNLDVAQPESLVLLPLYLSFRLVSSREHSSLRMRDGIALGVLTVAIAMFKFLYAPIPIAFGLAHLVMRRGRRRDEVPALVSATVTSSILVASIVGYFAYHHTWGWVAHTWFSAGPHMRSLSSPPIGRLFRSAVNRGVFAAPVSVGALLALTRLRKPWPHNDILAVSWLVLGLLGVLSQQWWQYQFLILIVPAGLLAGPWLASLVDDRRRIAAPVALVLCLAAVSDVSYTKAILHHGLRRDAIAKEIDPAYEQRDRIRTVLAASDARPGALHAFANPIVLLGSGRPDPIAIHGWSPEFLDTPTWDRLADEFRAQPPAYLIIDEFSEPLIRTRAAGLWKWIEEHYVRPATTGVPALWRERVT